MVVLLALGANTLLSNASKNIKASIYLSWGACYGPATNKWRITSFIDPSTGVDLLKTCSSDYFLL
jgi:hypothetical protein